MSHEPKLTVYTIRLNPESNEIQNSTRFLFRNIIGEVNNNSLTDSFIFIETFKKFIKALDQPKMFSDEKSKKSITANQSDIEDDDVDTNIKAYSEKSIIEGTIEGGTYGRKRKKTSILNKKNKTDVNEQDAITDDFYFCLYAPLASNVMILMLQSYSGDSVDSVMKVFWEKFLTVKEVFKKPSINRFIPKSIIQDFKQDATVSNLKFSTLVLGNTLLEKTATLKEKKFKVSVTITPIDGDLSIKEYENNINQIANKVVAKQTLGLFKSKKGALKDRTTNKESQFDIESNFEIKPVILLSKYIHFPNEQIDFKKVASYCKKLLVEIKEEIYPSNAVKER